MEVKVNRIIVIFVGLLFLLGCSRNNILGVVIEEIDFQKREPGKCYFSLYSKDVNIGKYEEAYVLEIQDPVFEIYEQCLSIEDLEAYDNGDEHYYFAISEPHINYRIPNRKNLDSYSYGDSVFYLCLVEMPAQFRYLKKEDIKSESIDIEFRKMIEPSKIIKTYVNKRPKKLKANQYYFESAYWTKEKEYVAATVCGSDLVKKIQEELIKIGYTELPTDNKLGKETKAALIDFQKKNGIPSGSLDLATLKLLGIQ